MTDRPELYPYDEPVIGGSAAAPPAPPPPYQDSREGDDEWYDEDELAEEWEDDYDRDGYEQSPARQPIFYIFVVAAIVLGAALVFLLFRSVGGDDDGAGGGNGSGNAQFKVLIDSPRTNDRIETGRDREVIVRATSTDVIAKFELFVDESVVAERRAEPPSGKEYRATLLMRFERKGEHTIFVRVSAESGAFSDSDRVKVSAVEPVGGGPITTIRGKVVASVSVRTGPGDSFEQVGTLNPGQDVTIIGRTNNNEWLLIEYNGAQRWLKRLAVEPADSLALLPVREPSPTPAPQPSPTSTQLPASPSPSVSPSPTGNLPDLSPANAILVDGGAVLRVTIANRSTTPYNGVVVIAVADVPAETPQLAFDLRLPANGSQTVDFRLNPRVTQQTRARVRVDPANSVRETSEDNNEATFVLAVPVEAPNLAIAPALAQDAIRVTITNSGGDLAAPQATVRAKVTVNGSTTETSRQTPLAIPRGGRQVVDLQRLAGPGTATIEVIVNNQVVATGTLQIP